MGVASSSVQPERGRPTHREIAMEQIEINLLTEPDLRPSLLVVLSMALWLPPCSPKNSWDFEGKMTTVFSVLYLMSVFSPLPSCVGLVQEVGKMSRGREDRVGKMLWGGRRKHYTHGLGACNHRRVEMVVVGRGAGGQRG